MDLAKSLNDRVLFAVPKKGRLHQKCLEILAQSDIRFHRNNRLDLALVMNLPMALIFLPAADIPEFVAEGRVDLGITGRDTVAEYQATNPPSETTGTEELLDLEFGRCKLQVQVPQQGDIQSVEALVGKRVATSFTALSHQYFGRLEGSNQPKTLIRPLSGSVEAACALGLADGIVDLVESGETMRVAGLKAIATVIETTAVLIRSKNPTNPKLVRLVSSRIQGVITAAKYVLCTYNVERSRLPQAKNITPGKRAPTVTGLEEDSWVAVQAMVPHDKIASVMDELIELGATDVLVTELKNTRTC
ncbi:putative ATP phosphoribosyltransferase His1 [Piedraia hortae CBS 480.64]|uniref:ATP phosphoribosyltransferase n=1 Tax=Piedraia hortae CBS 480.64 TaxID=1314780 RepID=A0A6A7C997_9PEZI|nr:putative ATP phosphoribosyltransferase His1 [Piedraia hortae CBS 480.64]